MVSDDESNKRPTRSASDNDLLRPRTNEDNVVVANFGSSGGGSGGGSSSSRVAFDDTASNDGGGGDSRTQRTYSASIAGAGSGGRGAGAGGAGAGGKLPKQPAWARKTSKSARGLFFRSGGAPKTQDGGEDSPPALYGGPADALIAVAGGSSSRSRKSSRSGESR